MSILALSTATVAGCICTPTLFSRLPLRMCHQLADPFCQAMEAARAEGMPNATLVVDVGAAYGIETTIARE